ncbi:MAG: sulfotransferase [Candidatus Rokuibacteriota bacterium]|nr:MAG: sulfotransferase [Candidatus Rokubacteria bacterium]
MHLSEVLDTTVHHIIRRGARWVERPGRRFVSLDSDSLLAAGRRRVPGHDFEDATFLEGLQRLVQALTTEARLNLLGRLSAREAIVGHLANRLQLERDRRQHPEIAAQEIERPIVITGLPRSGSTLLHRLLAQDPANRVPLTWETLTPSPPPERLTYDSDPRIAVTERNLRWFQRLMPEFSIIHPVGARLPEECVIILSHSFLSSQFCTMYAVPSYQTWVRSQNLLPAYRLHRRFLQQLQWRCGGSRWILKAPAHLPALKELCAVYPDVGVIMTHREPLEVLPSEASLHTVLRRTFSDAVDPSQVGREVTELTAAELRAGLQARDHGCVPPERFLDVRYRELGGDPIGTVRKVYAHFGIPFTTVAETRMSRHLAETPKDKHGAHVYSLAQFGLDADEERERYREYRERFLLN